MRIERFKAALLSTLIITSFAAFLLIATTAKPLEAHPGAIIENFLPTEDAHVMSGHPDEIQEGGLKYNFYTGNEVDEYGKERTYLKFDLSVIPSGPAVNYAKLRLYNKYSPSDGGPSYAPCTLVVEAKQVSDDSWLETTLKWNNAPPIGTVIDTKTIPSTQEDEWTEWDVTSWVKSQVSIDKIVSIAMRGQSEDDDSDCAVWFYSKDAFEDQPRAHLEVSWKGVGMSISPYENKGPSGEDVTFTVTIRNETGSQDTFLLTVDSEWETSLPSSVGPLSDGGSEDVTLTVTIPDDACPGDEDEITVTATSQADPMVLNRDSCFAGVPPLYPESDAEVNKYYPSKNYGDNDRITVGTERDNTSPTNFFSMDWRSYLKFDLSDEYLPGITIPSGATIESAYLSLFTHFGGENGANENVPKWERYGDATLTVDVKKVENDHWGEESITWNKKPSMGASLGSKVIPPDVDQRYEWDVTSYVQEEWAGDKIVSFSLQSKQEEQNKFVPFISKETTHVRPDYETDQRPYLIVCYTLENKHDVDVTITPSEDSGERGDTLSYTVTVKNTGDFTDTYTLENSDIEGWTLSLSQDSVGPLAPNASTDVTLEVTIPGDAEDGEEDTVTVTATCQAAPSVKDSGSCTATAEAPLGVSVSISPKENSAENGQTVTFTVTVTNNTETTDTYDLSVSDNVGWGPTLDDNLLEDIAPDGSGTTTLSVTIPDDAEHCTRDKITVTARSRENENLSDSDSCTAHCLVEELVGGVQVTIDPTAKSGAPGGEINFFVTITNTGAVDDTYNLTASDTWDTTLAVQSVMLAGGASRQNIRLTVQIPDGAAEGDSTTVTVTATGTYSENSATCTATAETGGISIVIPIAAVVVIVVIIGAVLVIKH